MKLRNKPSEFVNEVNAIRYAHRTIKPSRVFLGDNSKYWVVGMADGERLLKAGYEELKF